MERDWPRFYDKEGRPIDTATFSRLASDLNYRVIDQEDVLTQTGDTFWVSTVWLGIDHGFMSPAPIIFETMIFGDSMIDEFCERYATEEAAKAGTIGPSQHSRPGTTYGSMTPETRRGVAWEGEACPGTSWRGMVRQVMARHGTSGRGLARRGRASRGWSRIG